MYIYINKHIHSYVLFICVYTHKYIHIYTRVYHTYVHFVFTCGHLATAFSGSGYCMCTYIYIYSCSFVLQIYFAMWDMRLVGAGGGGFSYWQYENISFGITTAFGLPFRNCTGTHTHTHTNISLATNPCHVCIHKHVYTLETNVCMHECVHTYFRTSVNSPEWMSFVFIVCMCVQARVDVIVFVGF